MEIVDNFFEVNKFLKAIHERLDGAVAVVCIQKDRKTEVGRGGSFGLEKPKLYMTLGYNPNNNSGIARLIKAKDWSKTRYNPNGQAMNFSLVNGCKFIPGKEWYSPEEDN